MGNTAAVGNGGNMGNMGNAGGGNNVAEMSGFLNLEEVGYLASCVKVMRIYSFS